MHNYISQQQTKMLSNSALGESSQRIFDAQGYQEFFEKRLVGINDSLHLLNGMHKKGSSFSQNNRGKLDYTFNGKLINLPKKQIQPHKVIKTNSLVEIIKQKIDKSYVKEEESLEENFLGQCSKRSSLSEYFRARRKIFEKKKGSNSNTSKSSHLRSRFSDQVVLAIKSKQNIPQIVHQKSQQMQEIQESINFESKQPKEKQLVEKEIAIEMQISMPCKQTSPQTAKGPFLKPSQARRSYISSYGKKNVEDHFNLIKKVKKQTDKGQMHITLFNNKKVKERINSIDNFLKNFKDQDKIEQEQIQLGEIKQEMVAQDLNNKNIKINLTAKSVCVRRIVKDESGASILKNSLEYSKNINSKQQIASITKVMTSLLIVTLSQRFCIDLDKEKIIISERASLMPGTSAGLAYADTVSVYQILHALMLPSGNDAAIALGEWGGKMIRKFSAQLVKDRSESSQPKIGDKSMNFILNYNNKKKTNLRLFIHHMNKMAKSLHLSSTYFANTHGLMNEKSFSTADDVCRLAFFSMQNPTIKEVVSKRQFKCNIYNRTYGQFKQYIWINTNRLLSVQGFKGIKTGITPTAGPCLLSLFEISNRQFLIISLLKAKNNQTKFSESFEIVKAILGELAKGEDSSAYKRRLKRLKKYEGIQFGGKNQENNPNCDSDSEDEVDDCIFPL